MSHSIDDDIRLACEALRRGELILYPTDTVWGIGCDATRSDAIKKIFKLKQRADNKALIVLVSDVNTLNRYVDEIPEVAFDLIELSEKPITIVYDRGRNLAPELLGEDGSVGIRVTHENFSQRLCKAFRKPIVSTSANISGMPTPIIFNQISDEIKGAMGYIVSTRQEEQTPHAPSLVVKLSNNGTIKILRK